MYKYFKRFMDFTFSLLLFIAISPLFLIIGVMVRIKLGKPIFFKQIRTGYRQKKFNMIKFRTMINKRNEKGELLPDEERMTKFGKFLRSSSLDELPELISIIKGDMSIIGPRPLPSIYDDYYTVEEKKRFNVRGGLIPPSNFKNKEPIINWEEQLSCEAYYADNLSFKLDFKNFINVFGVVFNRKEKNFGGYIRKPLHIERSKELKKRISKN